MKKFRLYKFRFIILIIVLAIISGNKLISEHGSTHQNTTKESAQLVEAHLERIVDGDTLVVTTSSGEQKIRLLEINTPESVHSDKEKNCKEGEIASNFTKEFLQSYSTIYLSYDKEETDQYGRTLAYVWLKDNVDINNMEDVENNCLNAILIKEGMAEVIIYPPNDMYSTLFLALESEAQQTHTGLWATEVFYE